MKSGFIKYDRDDLGGRRKFPAGQVWHDFGRSLLFNRFQREMQSKVKLINPEARRLILDYTWPGNVRELENTLYRAIILCEGDTITVRDLPPRLRGEAEDETDTGELRLADAVKEAVTRVEKRLISSRLAIHNNNRTVTANSLGITRKTLFTKMRDLNLGAEEIPEGNAGNL